MRSGIFTMTFALILRTNGRVVARSSSSTTIQQQQRTSKLSKSFLVDGLTKTSFSTMTTGGGGEEKESSSKYFTIGMTGSNGLIGTALRNELSQRKIVNGKPVKIIQLKRGNEAEVFHDNNTNNNTTIELIWNPKATNPIDVIDPNALSNMDAIIHLSGENISTGLKGIFAPLGIRPWTTEKKQEILNSRTITTSALAKAIGNQQKSLSFLVASGVGAYGSNYFQTKNNDKDDELQAADESTDISQSNGFLAEVSRQWEASSIIEATTTNSSSTNRVVTLRNGVVLSTVGGALAKLYPIFMFGGGGIVGSGKQYFPFISARDMARGMVHVLETPTISGPVNMCAPDSCTNYEFTKAMGKVLNRPTILPFPAFAVSLLFGEMGEEILLGGTRATPKKLLDTGFEFHHPTVEEAIASAVKETI